MRAQCVVLDEFLAPQELDELISYTVQHESEFQDSAVVSPSGDQGVTDYNHRRSRVLMDLGKHEQVVLERIRCVLPRVLDQLGIEEFPITRARLRSRPAMTAIFSARTAMTRRKRLRPAGLTFVYFFNRAPRQFEGGELRLHDSRGKRELGTDSYDGRLPDDHAAAKPNRVFPVLDVARDYRSGVPIAGLR